MQNLTDRQEKILHLVVDDYVETAQPVGSRIITKRHSLGVSPATIRNEMAELEEEGYLQQPHTSAGRIPSDKGYRYYVDNLMEVEITTTKALQEIRRQYQKLNRDIENILHETVKLLAHITSYASVALTPDNKLWASGLPNIVNHPEFRDIDKIKAILEILEQEKILSGILRDEQAEDIHIGNENNMPQMKECSMVTAVYEIGGIPVGSFGVIGPTRMCYGRVLGAVRSVASSLKAKLLDLDQQ